MLQKLFAIVLAFPLIAPAYADTLTASADCDGPAPGMTFCSGDEFSRVDDGLTAGQSYWMHEDGYVSKLLVQPGPQQAVTQADIESQIIAMVSAQAARIGRSFEFSDLSSMAGDDALFGTINYTLAGDGTPLNIMHSYATMEGVLIQVISQGPVQNVSDHPVDLKSAHFDALAAIHLTGPNSAT